MAAAQGLSFGEQQAPEYVVISMTGTSVPDATPGDAQVYPGQTLFWEADQDDRFWVVIFKGDSPLANGKQLLWGRGKGQRVGGPVAKGLAAGEEYEYSVVYQDSQGVPHVTDPRVIIRDVR